MFPLIKTFTLPKMVALTYKKETVTRALPVYNQPK